MVRRTAPRRDVKPTVDKNVVGMVHEGLRVGIIYTLYLRSASVWAYDGLVYNTDDRRIDLLCDWHIQILEIDGLYCDATKLNCEYPGAGAKPLHHEWDGCHDSTCMSSCKALTVLFPWAID